MGASKAAKPRAMDAVQRALLARTPVAAERLLYIGTAGAAFADAALARNPRARVAAAEDADPVDVLAADDLVELLADPNATALLARAPILASAIPAAVTDPGALLADLTARGFTILHLQPAHDAEPYFDDPGQDLVAAWRAGRLPTISPPRALMVVARRGQDRPRAVLAMFSFSPTLMDIRTRLPAEAMRTEPDLLVQHHRPPGALSLAPADAPKILVLQRPAPPHDLDAWREAVLAHARDGWITVMEFDDHPALTAKANNRRMLPADWVRFAWVHAVQTSTPLLRDLFLTHNPETRLFPNAAFRLEPFPENLPKRVFYGAVSRGAHAVEVAASLGPAIDAFPGVEFVVVGDRAVFDALPTARKRYHDLVPYEDYLKLMGGCAISLSPIEAGDLYAAKSDAKYLDAASRGVLTIASPTIYADVIRHGKNGLIAPGVADWAPMLTQALRDDEGRRKMARNAWEYVQGARMFAQQVTARHDWYRDLWARRESLTAALVARMNA
ncbi:MAG: glycosyltransferase [Alphaproteobacteria bacterium]|nr:glycosyltransferase [Alphaproteobacteria bacterium]MBU2096870.1 glycosyltransferase [Alphaproteobacteria bacterium]MBU2153497.1 glycosyltransferase [Alphaproteobacteria bacterium]MBU2361940.1 glycosyltransferase [Alphaproteobacteria bacterium]